MQGKNVLITGANSGIGRSAAGQIARLGARVILACRDITKAKSILEYNHNYTCCCIVFSF